MIKMLLCRQWFEERALQLETLDSQLKKLHSSIELLVLHRRGRSTYMHSFFSVDRCSWNFCMNFSTFVVY